MAVASSRRVIRAVQILADEAFRLGAYVATGLIDAGEPFRGAHPRRRRRAASGRLE